MDIATANHSTEKTYSVPEKMRDELVTHEFPLEDIAEAFHILEERIGDPLKVVIAP
jgi:threonine dehydrogenase-like Zn-dependent dehydrogenase